MLIAPPDYHSLWGKLAPGATAVVVRALNWQALEPDARRVAEAQIGALVEDDDLPCPDELAVRARWE